MNVREAVQAAKKHLTTAFIDDKIDNLGLEEVEFDEMEGVWNITLGFSRPWSSSFPTALRMDAMFIDPRTLQRDYRVVRVRDEDGKTTSIKLREMAGS